MNMQEFMYLDDKINKIIDIEDSVGNKLNDKYKIKAEIDTGVIPAHPTQLPKYLQYKNRAVVADDDIYILTGDNNNNSCYTYRFDGMIFTALSSGDSLYPLYSAMVYDGTNIYAFGGNQSQSFSQRRRTWYGTSWQLDNDVPYQMQNGAAVCRQNKIHLLGANHNTTYYKKHVTFDGTSYTSLGSLPISFTYGDAVVYNNEIHIMCDSYHYKWNGSSWIWASSLPFSFNNGKAVAYNNEIHVFYKKSGKTNHYKWNGTSWTLITDDIGFDFYDGSAVVYNDEIYLIGGSDNAYLFYRYDGVSWINRYRSLNDKVRMQNDYPYDNIDSTTLDYAYSVPIFYNNLLYLLGSKSSGTSDCKIYDPMTKSLYTGPTLPINFSTYGNCSGAVVYNNEIHIFGSTSSSTKYHYYLSNGVWSSRSTLPYAFSSSRAVVYNNQIHILGFGSTYHYRFNGTSWLSTSTLPYSFNYGLAVVYHNEIHIIGGDQGKQNHYSWNGSTWTNRGSLPLGIVHDKGIYITADNDYIYIQAKKGIYTWNDVDNQWSLKCYIDYECKSFISDGKDNYIIINPTGSRTSIYKLGATNKVLSLPEYAALNNGLSLKLVKK